MRASRPRINKKRLKLPMIRVSEIKNKYGRWRLIAAATLAVIKKIRRGDADFYIGGKLRPYLRRWYIEQTEERNIYLHCFHRHDDDRALHDHPWPSKSIVLWGGYIEHLPGGIIKRRFPGQIIFRAAHHAHRIELYTKKDGTERRAWTLFITGRKVREWGFHCPRGWVHWKDFVDESDEGNIGKGCPQ